MTTVLLLVTEYPLQPLVSSTPQHTTYHHTLCTDGWMLFMTRNPWWWMPSLCVDVVLEYSLPCYSVASHRTCWYTGPLHRPSSSTVQGALEYLPHSW